MRTTAFMSYVKLNCGEINIVVLTGLLHPGRVDFGPRKQRHSDTTLNMP